MTKKNQKISNASLGQFSVQTIIVRKHLYRLPKSGVSHFWFLGGRPPGVGEGRGGVYTKETSGRELTKDEKFAQSNTRKETRRQTL